MHVVEKKGQNGFSSFETGKESVAQIAAYNEYGTPTIPERPAFRASFFKNRKKYIAILIKITRSGLKGDKLRKSAFDSLGKVAQRDIENSIAGGSWAANAESTQLSKGRGKQKINDPLIATGQMIDSVGYKVKKK